MNALEAPGINSDRRVGSRWAVWLHGASLFSAFLVLVWVNRNQWFIADEWDALLDRSLVPGRGVVGLWFPHFEHWSTIPIIVYRLLFRAFGLRTYVPYILVLIVLQLVVVHLLWRILTKNGVGRVAAACACAVFAVLGTGWENLTDAWQMTFLGSLAAGLGALLVMPEKGGLQRRDVLCWMLNVVSLACAGVALTMVGVCALSALFRRGVRTAILTISVPGGVYLIWYALAGRKGPSIGLQPLPTALRATPTFMMKGMVASLDGLVGISGVGWLLVPLIAGAVVMIAWKDLAGHADVLAMAIGAPVFLFLVALRRSGLGVAFAESPRYRYLAVAFLLPIITLALAVVLRPRWLRAGAAVVLTCWLAGVGLSVLIRNADLRGTIEQERKHRVLAGAEVLREGQAYVGGGFVAPDLIPNLDATRLRGLDAAGQLPSAANVTEADRLTARAYLQVGVVPPSGATAQMPQLAQVVGGTLSPAGPNCTRLTPSAERPGVALLVLGPSQVQVTTGGSGDIFVVLQSIPVTSVTGRPRTIPAIAGSPQHISFNPGQAVISLYFPAAGATILCGVTP